MKGEEYLFHLNNLHNIFVLAQNTNDAFSSSDANDIIKN